VFKSTGTIQYFDNPYKLIVEVDNEIGNYYRSFIPKFYQVRKPMYDSHISVVRNEAPVNLDAWNKYQDLKIEFKYDPFIYNDELYFWLNAYSDYLEDVRAELGLPVSSKFSRPPDGQRVFHITIGNIKHLR
jgi:hypothetical protein